MEVFKKVSIDFDYQQLRKDVEDTYNAIKLNAVGTVYEGISGRNQCITVSKENSDEWYDGIAGKSCPWFFGCADPDNPGAGHCWLCAWHDDRGVAGSWSIKRRCHSHSPVILVRP